MYTAPWEARTPDLEVNGLTLWPAELRKLLSGAEAMKSPGYGPARSTKRSCTLTRCRQQETLPGKLELPTLRLTASRSGQLS